MQGFQWNTWRVILVSAAENNRFYPLASSEFIMEPRRLIVALSRAKQKLILVVSRSIFELLGTNK